MENDKETEKEQKTRWYLSFAGDTFLGACIVEAKGFIDAVTESHRLKISPGGQVRGHPVPEDVVLEPRWCNRLLTKADLQEMFPEEKIQTEREKKIEEQRLQVLTDRVVSVTRHVPLEGTITRMTIEPPEGHTACPDCEGYTGPVMDTHAIDCPRASIVEQPPKAEGVPFTTVPIVGFSLLNAKKKELSDFMSELFEEYYSAGWLDGLEFQLWEVLEGNAKAFAGGKLKPEEVTRLRQLRDGLGGWFYLNPDTYEEDPGFEPSAAFARRYLAWKQRKTELDERLRAHVADLKKEENDGKQE